MKQKKLLKRVAALALAATMVVGELPYFSLPTFATEIDPSKIPDGETIFTVTGNMTNPAWVPYDLSNQLKGTNVEGVYAYNLTMPAYDEANAWASRISICAFNNETPIAGWNKILLGVSTIAVGDLGNGLLGDLTNLTQIRVPTPVETEVTVYFDKATYGLAILDENGNSVEYQIGWCTSDDQETYYTPEQFAQMTWDDYIAQLSVDRQANLETLGVEDIPDFVSLRDNLLAKLDNVVIDDDNVVIDDSEETDSTFSVVGSPDLGLSWSPDSQNSFVKNNGDGTYSKKFVAKTSDGFYEFKIIQDGYTFYWTYQMALGKGIIEGNASQFQLPDTVPGDEFEVIFSAETSDVVVKKNGIEFDYLVRWATDVDDSEEYLTKEEAIEKYVTYADWKYNLLEDGTIEITGYNKRGYREEIVVPEQIAGRTVTKIGKRAFFCNYSGIRSVTLPNTILEIGEDAFNSCQQLETINLPDSIVSIGKSAFAGCMLLKDVDLPNKLEIVEDSVFCGCSSLKSIELPETLVSIGKQAFSRSALAEITIPSNVTEIGEKAFTDCSNLKSINILGNINKLENSLFLRCYSLESVQLPPSVMVIGNSVFGDCRNLKKIELPANVTIIGYSAFNSCIRLESISLPVGLKSIETAVFGNCSSLKNIDLPMGLTSIASSAFLCCRSLEFINIPASVTHIGDYAFQACKRLKVVTIPDGVQELSRGIFSDCTRLYAVNMPKSILKIKAGAFKNCTSLLKIKLPSNIKSLGKNIFAGCTKLTDITLPASLEYITKDAFGNIPNLYNINVDEENLKYCSVNGILFSKEPYALIACPGKKSFETGVCGKNAKYALLAEDGTLVISGTNAMSDYDINYADDGAFGSSIANMKDYYLGYADDEAPNSPFALDYRIKDIVILGNKMTNIGDLSFYGCTGLTKLTIPSCITKIGTSAFYKCENLTDVEIGPEVTSIGDSAFDGCPNLTIHCEENSVAHKYAMLNSINYKIFAKNYIVSFDVNGGANTSVDNKEVEENTAVGTLPTTNREGYIFKGWYTDKTAGTEVTEETVVTADMTVYAQWEKESVTLTEADVTIADTSFAYDGTAKEASVTVKAEGITLVKNADYTVSYKNNVNAGTATVTVAGIGRYDGTIAKTYEIIPATIENAEVNVLSTDIIYDGTAKEAIVQVIVDNKVLKKDTDYTVTYVDNTKVGTAKVTITGTGNYNGTATTTYEIKTATLKAENITLSATEYIYDGSAKQADVIVKVGAATLVKDTDYKVAYANNTEAGTAAVTITGMGNYTGLVEKEYIIKPCSVESAELTLEATEVTFNGMEQSPAVQVTLGEKVLVNGTDYNVTYTNNKDKGLATVTVTGTGNYNGNIAKEYKINAYNIENAEVNILSTDVVYDGAVKNVKIQVIANNRVLKEVEDYSILYLTNTNAGTAKFGLVGHGNYTGSVVKTFEIKQATIKKSDVTVEATEYIYDGKEKKPSATVTINGKTLKKDVDYIVTYEENIEVGYGRTIITGIGNYTGTVERMLRIKKASLSSVELAKTEFIFSEEDQEPKLTVKSGNKKLKEDEDYEVYYKKNYGIGTAKVIVIGIGNYTGKLTESFKIMPQEVKEVTQTGSKSAASITLTWTATPGVSGYEIYRSTSKNGDYTIVKYQSANTYKDVKLEADTKYYYKVRAYRTVNKEKYYGDFSKVISAETIVAAPEFTLTASEEAVTVNWDKSKGADGYEVYMASSKKATFKNIKSANTNGRKYKKTGLKSGKTYYFKVRAYQSDASGKKIYSAFSEIQEVTVK